MLEAKAVMANSFLVMVSIWFAMNILFVAWRLWVTRPDGWEIGARPHQLCPIGVRWHLRRRI